MNDIWSLFSGIGGLELGLERAGLGRVSLQAEQDKFCLEILRNHWPNTLRVEDVRHVRRDRIVGLTKQVVGHPFVLCGGFPCQPVSLVGRGKAQDDERWLWPEFERIIGEFRPEWVVAENVPGLRKRGLNDVLGGLAALGYDAEWIRLSAAAMGAPHLRERLFIVAYPGGERRQEIAGGSPSDESNEDARRPAQEDHVADGHAESDSGGDVASSRARVFTSEARARLPIAPDTTVWATEPDVGRVAYGVPRQVDKLRALGNAVVPQCAQFVGECIMEAIKRG